MKNVHARTHARTQAHLTIHCYLLFETIFKLSGCSLHTKFLKEHPKETMIMMRLIGQNKSNVYAESTVEIPYAQKHVFENLQRKALTVITKCLHTYMNTHARAHTS